MNAGSNPKIARLEARDQFSNNWVVPLTKTCTKKPAWCCYAMCCPYCASWQNRKAALHGDMSRYICCAGHWPCSGKMKEQDCPEFCLCLEVCCCFAQSVASTRWMLQDRLRIRNTKCDNCIIQTMVCLQCLNCVCHIIACLTSSAEIDQLAECVDLIADIAWCTVCGCMQTQVKVEMDENPRFQQMAAAGGAFQAPTQQQMGRHNMPTHAPAQQQMAGYPAQAGYPPQGAYPPQGGYPPPGPRPAQHAQPPPGYPQY